MSKSTISLKTMAVVAVFTAIVCVISTLKLPFEVFGVPATLQTFVIAFAGFVLGYKKGTLSILIYIIIGAIGIPVFSGFTGGFSVILGVTGGFIIGFLFLGFFSGLGMKIKTPNNIVNIILRIVLSIIGLLVCHFIGILAAAKYLGISIGASALAVSIPYLPKDIISIVIAYFLAIAVKKAMANTKLDV